MKYSLLTLTLFLFLLKGLAQNQLPPVFIIDNDTSTYYDLGDEYWQMLEDSNNEFTIKQVSESILKNKFNSNSTDVNGIDYSIHTFWIQYRLKNTTTKNITICLLNNNNADKADFYISNNNIDWIHKATGVLYPLNKRDGLKKINCIPLTLNQGEEVTVVNQIANNYYINKPGNLSVRIGIYPKVLQRNYIEGEENYVPDSLEYLFNGIYLFGIFLYFFFFLVTRERLYLYYSLFLLYLFLTFEPLQYIFFPGHPSIYSYFIALTNGAGVFLYIQFIREFLKTSLYTPGWDKFLNAISLVEAFSIVISFFIEPHLNGNLNRLSVYIIYLLFFVSLLSMAVTFLLYIRKKNSSIFLLLISGLPVIIFEAFFGGLLDIYDFLSDKFNIETPKFVMELGSRYEIINSFLMAWLAIVFSWILFQRFLQLQKKNAEQALEKLQLQKEKEIEKSRLIEQQKIELEKTVEERTTELRHSLKELKETQSQLIQSEKMASLGELTAGIAHEIQNPLNFVNNFSEVSNEMIDEMKEELATGNLELATEIANDIKQNLEKINHHGKRADAIVKGMLEHSKTSTGKKEPTDINALCDEYLRLSYHGLRAKDKSFNAEIKTDFDEAIGKINIIPQDIGRVLLNLFNNAFYAVNEKKKTDDENYQPMLTVTTKRSFPSPLERGRGEVEIRVSDNGSGIPSSIKDKIFQPFFTTKPTGEGTGLGLSLSYDIIKAHSGKIKVETKDGEGTTFIIQLPVV